MRRFNWVDLCYSVLSRLQLRQQQAQGNSEHNDRPNRISASYERAQHWLKCNQLWDAPSDIVGFTHQIIPEPKGHLINILSDTRLALVSPNLRRYAWKKGVTKLRWASQAETGKEWNPWCLFHQMQGRETHFLVCVCYGRARFNCIHAGAANRGWSLLFFSLWDVCHVARLQKAKQATFTML